MAIKIAQQSERLSDLQLRKLALQRKIAAEKRRLRDQSRVRAGIRARLVGAVVLRLREEGRLSESVVREIEQELLTQTYGKNREFEALQGSVFDLTSLLHDISEVAGTDEE